MHIGTLKSRLSRTLPRPVFFAARTLYRVSDIPALSRFLFSKQVPLSFGKRLKMVALFYTISLNVDCPHTQEEILAFVTTMLRTPKEVKGCFVEAGCFKGGSTAKFSLAAREAGRKLVVFDSFRGLPSNEEQHTKTIFGGPASFAAGTYRGSLAEVTRTVRKYGSLAHCTFVEGWFEDTMTGFSEPVAGIYLDVDLASSTRTCLKYLYPLLQEGGVLYSQDGHLPLVLEVFDDNPFWENEVGCKKPRVEGFGKKKLIRVVKQS